MSCGQAEERGVVVILKEVKPQFNDKSENYSQEELVANSTSMIEKTLDGTNYRVQLHFSETSHETLKDKIIRMLENEISESI